MTPHIEKRKQVRIAFQSPVELQWRSDKWSGSGAVANMSQAGCYVLTQNPGLLGERMYLRLSSDLPEIESVVRYVSPQVGMGLEFVGLQRESEQQLAQFLKAKAVLWA